MKTTSLLAWLAVMLSPVSGIAQESDAGAILAKVNTAYGALQSYQSEGTITSDIGSGGDNAHFVTSFTLKMEKPNRYLITWNQRNPAMPIDQSGAVWNDGAQPYLYMGITKAYAKMNSDRTALASATGISGGAAFTVPSLFLSIFKERAEMKPFSTLVNPQVSGNEPVEGDDCYIVSGASKISKNETLWISKTSFLIRKYSRSFEPHEGGMAVPKLTDQQIEESIKAMGQTVTEERKETMRNMMKKASSRTSTMKGSFLEIQTRIDHPAFAPGDFSFKPPAEAVLKDSLFDVGSKAK